MHRGKRTLGPGGTARRNGLAVNGQIDARIGDGRQPVFQLRVEAVLRAARLKIEEAEDQRAGKTEQRGRKRRAHARQRRRQAGFQRGENIAAVARCRIEPLDDVADGADRADQTPEGTEQTEENQKADEIARRIARFIQARGDGIENGALRDGRDPHFAALADQRPHRRQELRRTPGLVDASGRLEIVEPAHFGAQAQDLHEHQNDADGENAENEAVQTRIGHEG